MWLIILVIYGIKYERRLNSYLKNKLMSISCINAFNAFNYTKIQSSEKTTFLLHEKSKAINN